MKTGVIGLGAMGAYMAKNFHKTGHLHQVWNRTESKAQTLASELGITAASSPQELASNCELILLCVSRDEDVMEMVNAICETISAETVVVDTSTVSSATAQNAADLLANKNVHFLDCPVSGGVEGAKNATLAMMVGGEKHILEKARLTLESIANKIQYMGKTGSGQATKAVNQLMCAGINQAVTEALAFGKAMDLEMDKVVDVVATGAAGNWFLDHRGKTMLAGEYETGFKLALHHKDLKIVQSMAADRCENRLPMAEMTIIHYEKLMQQGYGDEDISSLYRLKHELLC